MIRVEPETGEAKSYRKPRRLVAHFVQPQNVGSDYSQMSDIASTIRSNASHECFNERLPPERSKSKRHSPH